MASEFRIRKTSFSYVQICFVYTRPHVIQTKQAFQVNLITSTKWSTFVHVYKLCACTDFISLVHKILHISKDSLHLHTRANLVRLCEVFQTGFSTNNVLALVSSFVTICMMNSEFGLYLHWLTLIGCLARCRNRSAV